MLFGVHIGQQNLSMDKLRSTWRRFDAAGIDWISVWDHLYEAPPAGGTIDHFEAVSTLGALCSDTTRCRVGCLVFYVGYRNPALLAKTAATLDHISGGRFELGIGAGWHEWEALAFGYDFPPLATRFEMLAEAAEIITAMLSNGRFSFQGRHFRTEDVANLPRPVQSKLPIWIGGVGEKKTLPLAARWADGWNAAYVSAAEFQRLNNLLNRLCETNGRDPASLKRTVNLQFVIGADEADADRIYRETVRFWGSAAERTMGGALVGTPDRLREQIDPYVDAGVDGINIALRAPWSEESVEAYIETVLDEYR